MRRSPALAAATLAAALLLAGCADSGDPTGPPGPGAAADVGAEPNAADVAFLQGMIPHHGQALAMARMAPERAAAPAVRDLAARIEAAQAPEIEAMGGWLRGWGEAVPDAGAAGAAAGHASHGIAAGAHEDAGMLAADELAALAAADGAAWDELFLTGMIAHHEGAVAMAETVLAEGADPDVQALAQAVVDAQRAEVEEMRALLAGGTPVAAPVLPEEVAHIHGIGRNPADGRLYLGTHAGLFTLDPSGATRVGETTVDLMGFVVAGPDHFYASGHPGAGDALPDPVGLIETRDAGRTWQPVSRTGESDFHALTADATGTRVYAFDGVLRASRDGGRTWRDGADGLQAAAVAASPADADVVLATTRSGVQRSDDGGVTFTLVDGAPVLVFLAWAGDAAVWGVDPVGVLHASGDGGRSWQRRGATGARPQALTADADGVTVATERRVLTSADGLDFATVAVTGSSR